MDDLEAAERSSKLALDHYRELGDAAGESHALAVRSEILLRKSETDPAREAATRSLAIARDRGLRREMRDAHVQLGQIHRRAQRIPQAVDEFRRALDLIEAQRENLLGDDLKMRFFAAASDVYEEAIALQAMLEVGSDPAAPATFQLVERASARALADLLVESRAAAGESIPEPLAERQRQIADRVSTASERLAAAAGPEQTASARQELAAAEQASRRFQIELRRAAPAYAELAYPDPTSLADLQEVLDPDEALLRYFLGAENAFLWVVERGQAQRFELGATATIEAQVEAFLLRANRSGAGLGIRPEGERESETLAASILGPGLEHGRRLLIVPHGALHRLPFPALRSKGRYLIQDHQISSVPSASTLRVLRSSERPVAAGGFLGIGQPDAPGDGMRFPELPYSGQALDEIAFLFSEADPVILKSDAATRESLDRQALDQFRIIHFATHGWAEAENSARVGLRLSPDRESQRAGFLYVDEVYRMDLAAEVVVLAGCQTGLGELLPGEGLVGLTRAFLYAGARSALVSLWNVGDRSTAEFMKVFYRELDGRTIPEALRRAQVSFLESDRPAQRQFYQWAPFILVGDPGRTPVRLNPSGVRAEP